ncbi:MAG: MFS transporter [Gemmataceae bacterium]|nr:MFS transporter [Gemmataceae bacterium]
MLDGTIIRPDGKDMPTNDVPNPEVALASPTRARYVVLAYLCSMAVVLYLDRLCLQQALVPMQEEFGLAYTQMSYVHMAFTLAYGIFEIPTGRWGDRFGSRGVLTRIVLWWSAFTALTGCVPYLELEIFTIPLSLTLLILIRFLFGAGEAGAIPNAARILMNWFSSTERGSMQGWFQASMHVGGAIASPVAAWIILSPIGWRGTFVIFGGIGLFWAALFYWWFRDKPGEHPGVNQAELQIIGVPAGKSSEGDHAVPWREALSHPNVWLLGIITMTSAFNSYFFFSWYSPYLQKARDVDEITAGWLSALALAGATCGSLIGGVCADFIVRHSSDRYRARRLFCLGAYASAAICLFSSIHIDTPWLSAVFCALACLMLFCQLPTWWACSFEVSGKHTGSMFGLLNGSGVIGAMGSQYFFGAFVDWRMALGFEGRDRWDPAFYLSIGLLVVGGILWQFMCPRRAIGAASP